MQIVNLDVNVEANGKSTETNTGNRYPLKGESIQVVNDENHGDFIVTVKSRFGEQNDFRIDFREQGLPFLHHWNFSDTDEPLVMLFRGNYVY